MPPYYSRDLHDLVRKMLVVDAKLRPSINDILLSPYVVRHVHALPKHLQDHYNKHYASAALLATRKDHKVIATIKVPRFVLFSIIISVNRCYTSVSAADIIL